MPDIFEQEQSEVVLERHYSLASAGETDHLIEYSTLWQQVHDICPDQMSFDLVLMQLAKDRKIVVAHTNIEKNEKVCPVNGYLSKIQKCFDS